MGRPVDQRPAVASPAAEREYLSWRVRQLRNMILLDGASEFAEAMRRAADSRLDSVVDEHGQRERADRFVGARLVDRAGFAVRQDDFSRVGPHAAPAGLVEERRRTVLRAVLSGGFK